MPKHGNYQFAAAVLVLILAIAAQFAIQFSFPLVRGVPLAALFALAPFVGIAQMLFLSSFVALVMNSSPGFSRELALLMLMPVAIALFAHAIPARPWVKNMLTTFFGMVVFYVLAHGSLAFEHVGLVFQTSLAALVPGAMVFHFFKNAYE